MKTRGPVLAWLENFRVPDQRWCSYAEAGSVLRVRPFHVAALVYIDVLELGVDSQDERGVTRASLETEREWRRQHGRVRRVWRMTKGYVANSF
jgi:hypothetical protein